MLSGFYNFDIRALLYRARGHLRLMGGGAPSNGEMLGQKIRKSEEDLKS